MQDKAPLLASLKLVLKLVQAGPVEQAGLGKCFKANRICDRNGKVLQTSWCFYLALLYSENARFWLDSKRSILGSLGPDQRGYICSILQISEQVIGLWCFPLIYGLDCLLGDIMYTAFPNGVLCDQNIAVLSRMRDVVQIDWCFTWDNVREISNTEPSLSHQTGKALTVGDERVQLYVGRGMSARWWLQNGPSGKQTHHWKVQWDQNTKFVGCARDCLRKWWWHTCSSYKKVHAQTYTHREREPDRKVDRDSVCGR